MTEKKLIEVSVTIEVMADNREQAENYIDEFLQREFIYGLGKSIQSATDDPEGEGVVRIFDYDFWLDGHEGIE